MALLLALDARFSCRRRQPVALTSRPTKAFAIGSERALFVPARPASLGPAKPFERQHSRLLLLLVLH